MKNKLSATKKLCMAFIALSISACAHSPTITPIAAESSSMMQVQKLTPVLLTDDVQACALFWENLGFQRGATIPNGDGLAFAMLSQGDIELMYQSFELANTQSPAVTEGVGRSVLYFEVDTLELILNNIDDHDVVVPENTTDYGAREIYVRDPAGNVIGFAVQSSQT